MMNSPPPLPTFSATLIPLFAPVTPLLRPGDPPYPSTQLFLEHLSWFNVIPDANSVHHKYGHEAEAKWKRHADFP